MRFVIEKHKKDLDKTFSEEALYTTLTNVQDYVKQMIAKVLMDGFDKKKPIQKLVIEINMIADDKEVDNDEILEKYPRQIAVSEKYLAEKILRRAGVVHDR